MSRRLNGRYLGLGLALGILALVALPLARAGAAESRPAPRSVGVVPLLAALDRVIHLEINNAPIRDTFVELARAGNIKIVVDSAVREDLRVSAVLKGLPLGDAITMVCWYAQLQLLPGEGSVIVVPLPAIAVAPGAAPMAVPQPGQPNVNPWQAWFELGLPLVPGGRTGYPKRFAGAVACPRCQAPMEPHWTFCPRCGQQRLPATAHGRYCWGCGKPLGEPAAKAPGAAPAPGTGERPTLHRIPLK